MTERENHVLVTVSGPDHPGITSTLMAIIVRHRCKISDIGQSVTHGLLSLSFYLDTSPPDDSSAHRSDELTVVKDLLFAAKNLGLTLEYKTPDELTVESPSDRGDKYILNCIATEQISPDFLLTVSKLLSDHNINITRIDNLTENALQSLELTTLLPSNIDAKNVKNQLLKISNQFAVDIAYLKDNVFRRSKRLIVFDMDSTLIQTEVIDEMAEAHGVGDKVKSITERAMNGELDFDQALKERVALLEGLPEETMHTILANLKFTPGVETFIKTVKDLGYKLAVLSGGFTFFANALKDKLGLNYAIANDLEIRNGALTGKVTGEIVNGERKALLLKLLAQQENISLEQVVAIGDGANDLPMLTAAGLGIAYHAKEVVKERADHHMSHGPMTSILYFLGIPGPNENS